MADGKPAEMEVRRLTLLEHIHIKSHSLARSLFLPLPQSQVEEQQAPAATGKAAKGKGGGGKRFEVKKWNAVAMWSWAICTDTCAICRNNLYEPSIEYQANPTGTYVCMYVCVTTVHSHALDSHITPPPTPSQATPNIPD